MKRETIYTIEIQRETEGDNMYHYHSVQIQFIAVAVSSVSNRLGFYPNNNTSFNTATLANNSFINTTKSYDVTWDLLSTQTFKPSNNIYF